MKTSNRHIVLADRALLKKIAANLRQSDIEELEALRPNVDAGAALFVCVFASAYCRVIYAGNEPIAVTGVIPRGDSGFAPWLVGTDAINKNRLAFMRSVRLIMAHYKEKYMPLENYVDARQEKSIRFISGLGFAVDAAKPLGAGMFRRFFMEE